MSWIRVWFIVQSLFLSELGIALFFVIRTSLRIDAMREQQAYMQGLLTLIAVSWGDKPEAVKLMLDVYVKAHQFQGLNFKDVEVNRAMSVAPDGRIK